MRCLRLHVLPEVVANLGGHGGEANASGLERAPGDLAVDEVVDLGRVVHGEANDELDGAVGGDTDEFQAKAALTDIPRPSALQGLIFMEQIDLNS
jgi:hypothetical protein